MKKLFYSAIVIFIIGKWSNHSGFISIGYLLFSAWGIIFAVTLAQRAGMFGSRLVVEKIEGISRRKRDDNEYSIQVRREIERDRLQAEMKLEIYRKQADLIIEYKKKGADITKDLFEMRKNLLELESAENKNMIEEIIRILDGI